MEATIHHLVSLVGTHATTAYLVIFAAALLEAIPVIGSLIPGTTVILALSAFLASGSLAFGPVLFAAISGAVLGDGVSFWIGHRNQRAILSAWPLSRYPKLVAQSEMLLARYGRLAIFLARFLAPVRAVAPITAGALGMTPGTFYPVNIAAVVAWAFCHTVPGAVAGTVLERYGVALKHYALPLAAGLVILGIVGWLLARRWRRRSGALLP